MPKRLVSRIIERRGPEAARRFVGLKAALAAAVVALGVAAFLEPTRTAIPSVRLVGAIMLTAGLVQAALATTARRQDPLAHGPGTGIANAGVGALCLAAPQLGVTTLSLVLAVAQITVGVTRGLAAWRDRGPHWRAWLALGGLLVVSGTSIALAWPESGLVAIGRFVGINLVVEGLTWLSLLWRVRSQRAVSVTLAPIETPAEAASHKRP